MNFEEMLAHIDKVLSDHEKTARRAMEHIPPSYQEWMKGRRR